MTSNKWKSDEDMQNTKTESCKKQIYEKKKTKGNCGLQTQADFSSPLMNDSNSNILNGSHDPKSEHQTK